MREYILKRWIEVQKVAVAMGNVVARHVTKYSIRASNASEVAFGIVAEVWVPCSSKLNYVLTGIYYDFDWDSEERVPITEEEAQMLKYVFHSQREYKLWRRAFIILREVGKIEAKEFLIEQAKVLALRRVIRGEEK